MSESVPDPVNERERGQLSRNHSGAFELDAPEPDDGASVRAERGSPTPSSVTVDQPLPDPRPTSQIVDLEVSPSDPSSSSVVPSSSDIPTDPELNSNVVRNSCTTSAFCGRWVSSELLAQLLNIGFDEVISTLALQRTNNSGVEQAVNWIIDHSNPSDLDEDSSIGDESEGNSTGEEESAEMGATSSTVEGGGPPQSGTVAEENALMKAIRAAQKNSRTHKMVLVANMSLKMGAGKLAAQVGHATLAVYRQAVSCEQGQSALDSWMRHGQVKIVLKGESTEQLIDLFKTAKDAGCFAYLVQDAGYTQIPPGSRTVLGVFGEKEVVDSVTGKLRLL